MQFYDIIKDKALNNNKGPILITKDLPMSFTFAGKIALVTGANRGIGKGFVSTLLNAGVERIYATARQLGELKPIVELNPEVIQTLPLDIIDSDSIKTLVNRIPKLDILINNAGIVGGAQCTSIEAAEIARQEMDVNLFGPMALTTQLLPLLKQSSQAAIINISSIAGICNFPAIGTYSISKAAMLSYTQGLRADLAKDAINIIGVYPGPHDTRLAAGMEMEKPAPNNVAIKTLQGLTQGQLDIYPDNFAQQMYATLRAEPQQLADLFAEMSE